MKKYGICTDCGGKIKDDNSCPCTKHLFKKVKKDV